MIVTNADIKINDIYYFLYHCSPPPPCIKRQRLTFCFIKEILACQNSYPFVVGDLCLKATRLHFTNINFACHFFSYTLYIWLFFTRSCCYIFYNIYQRKMLRKDHLKIWINLNLVIWSRTSRLIKAKCQYGNISMTCDCISICIKLYIYGYPSVKFHGIFISSGGKGCHCFVGFSSWLYCMII